MPDADADTIRLTLPPDEDMRPVVEVAVGVVARRWGLSDVEVRAARAATGGAMAELAGMAGEAPVQVAVLGTDHHLEVHLVRGTDERTISLP